jgi:hypothetical protein
MDRMADNLAHSATPETPADVLRRELRAGLSEAIRNRDVVATAALRSALSAIDNAEAPDEAHAPKPTAGHATLAGTVAGLGAAEVERRILSEAELERIIEAEITDRDHAAETYRLSGRADMADRLKAQADVLRPYLARPTPPA